MALRQSWSLNILFAVEAADVAVSADEEELPQRLSHADAHKLGLTGAVPRQRG